MLFYIVNIFLSAFLLFQIQPMIAKYILPWFGGTTAVWSTVQLYFQVLLTGGYAYANWLVGSDIKNNRRGILHFTILALAFLQVLILGFLWASPVTPGIDWRPGNDSVPAWDIFKLLTVSVGLAYFLLSTNSPIMQAWFSRAYPARSPYILYALSNIGSLLGLITYPLLVEPTLSLAEQGWMWSVGFLLFALFTIFATWKYLKTHGVEKQAVLEFPSLPSRGTQMIWLLLSGVASWVMLATTSHITQEVAAIPFLWVLPLLIYLLTFIIAFSDSKLYSRKWVLSGFYLFTLLFVLALVRGPFLGIPVQVVIYSLTLFFAVMLLHGELYLLRPHPAHLTRFYLMVSIGGALGGAFVNFGAPLLFKGFWELPLGIIFAWATYTYLRIAREDKVAHAFMLRHRQTFFALALTSLGLVFVSFFVLSRDILFVERNFYGLIRVDKSVIPGSKEPVYKMVHGITVHGVQYINPSLMHTPTAYFSESSGIGLLITNHPRRGSNMRVGIVGMGIGVLAAYGQAGDDYRMYEINSSAIRLAKGEGGYFTFLQNSPASIHVIAGDGRIALETELEQIGSNQFDILILDAFSSDSVPVHLVTEQAFSIYTQHLKTDGILAMNITNNYLDLRPIAWQLAKRYKLHMAYISDSGDGQVTYPSQWVILARDIETINAPALVARMEPLEGFSKELPLWTDNYSNLFQVLRSH